MHTRALAIFLPALVVLGSACLIPQPSPDAWGTGGSSSGFGVSGSARSGAGVGGGGLTVGSGSITTGSGGGGATASAVSVGVGGTTASAVSAGVGGAGSGAGGAGGATSTAAGTGGSIPDVPMIPITTPDGSFSIDATEVTNGAYAAFLASAPPTDNQPSYCSWNTTFQPKGGSPGGSDYPVVNVDWCDAYAYCAWAGKRLCGAIGGGATPYYAYGDAAQSQWYAACSADGTLVYPYGNFYSPGTCNGQDFGAHAPIPVGAASGCDGGIGLYDMSGNVFEWEDGCGGETGPNDVCRLRGGSWNDHYLECSFGTSDTTRSETSSNFGFRCCSL